MSISTLKRHDQMTIPTAKLTTPDVAAYVIRLEMAAYELLASGTSTIQGAEVEGSIADFAIVKIFDAPPFGARSTPDRVCREHGHHRGAAPEGYRTYPG